VCRVEPLADGFESIPLSSMKHYPAAPAIRKSAAQIASVAHHIRPRAEDIARAYENNDDDAIKQILMSIFPFGG
jgi:hypothetical protein